MARIDDIYSAVSAERRRQDEKWGEQNHEDEKWVAILMEEVGEVAKAALEGCEIETELVQAMAVAVAWLECSARRQERSLRGSYKSVD